MAGIIIPILAKQRFDFSFLSAAASKTIVLHSALNVIPFKSARLLLRIHDFQHTGGGNITLNVYGTAPSSDDPNEFTDGAAVLSAVANNTTASGDLIVDTDGNIPPIVKIAVTALQDPAAAQTLYGELSADLVVRES